MPEPSIIEPPTRRERALAKALTRLNKLPPPTSGYTITRDVPIPMRDGVTLLADLYTPTGPVKGTVLVRSPYGFGMFIGTMTGGVLAARGYRMVLARCRGTFGSGGEFDPMRHEVDDGADTVEWMRNQPWFDGRFATHGGSYLAFTQWALLMDPPPELVAAVISISPHDFYASSYKGGAFSLGDFLGWTDQVRRQEEPNFAKLVLGHAKAQRTVPAASAELPLSRGGEQLLEGGAPWYAQWISHRDPDDPFWAPMRLGDALDRVQCPVLLQSGWQDVFVDQTMEQYERLHARGVDVALTVGPWTHIEPATKGRDFVVNEILDWLDEHLADSGVRSRPTPVHLFVTGAAQQWRDLPAWPPATTDRVFHLRPNGGLGDDPAPAGSTATFTYDPADPTPTIGGPTLLRGGYKDDSALASRRDAVTFTTDPLNRPLEVIGYPTVELAHTTDNPYADVFVRVSDVDASGASTNVTEGFLRLGPADANGIVHLRLDPIAHRFGARHRIRLVVAGGSFPHWERNLGTADDPATSSRLALSTRTIDLTESTLTLPVGT